jgi:hypothetical protein
MLIYGRHAFWKAGARTASLLDYCESTRTVKPPARKVRSRSALWAGLAAILAAILEGCEPGSGQSGASLHNNRSCCRNRSLCHSRYTGWPTRITVVHWLIPSTVRSPLIFLLYSSILLKTEKRTNPLRFSFTSTNVISLSSKEDFFAISISTVELAGTSDHTGS